MSHRNSSWLPRTHHWSAKCYRLASCRLVPHAGTECVSWKVSGDANDYMLKFYITYQWFLFETRHLYPIDHVFFIKIHVKVFVLPFGLLVVQRYLSKQSPCLKNQRQALRLARDALAKLQEFKIKELLGLQTQNCCRMDCFFFSGCLFGMVWIYRVFVVIVVSDGPSYGFFR